jgi:hypothetical protein
MHLGSCLTRFENTVSGSWEPKIKSRMHFHETWTGHDELTQILFPHVPSQVPTSFKIVPLPIRIISWMTLLLQRLPINPQYNKVHTMTTLGCGKDGPNTATPQDSQGMSSLQTTMNNNKHTYLAVFPWLSMKGDFCDQGMLPWLLVQSHVRSTKWQQPLGVTVTTTQQEIAMET